ncbi:glucose-6-phosphate isomerase [Helicobacter enhydrae]|uniref:Glucose-6-phosphate isomerase n=1 Tax=Helicobacter enhydrae TaxID=222136 RepID=A0A1B1U7G9_9HELI|nr:glucose-6-phosphate isomerase [Helicobacter enhydrae]ANV97320.1 glucose-6-phosphate isomerase [Helicobacter enhydrae]ANV98690.1 glucose-6-phosphate isomerase [Helicobacter enhydrae]
MIKFESFYDAIRSRSIPNPSSEALDSVYEAIVKEKVSNKSGYYNLPFESRAIQDSRQYIQANQEFLCGIKHLVIIGVGGSSLGTKAIDTMLCHLPNRKAIELKFLEHTDPIEISKTLQGITLADTLFLMVSKSGSTIETSSLAKYVIHHFELLSHPKHLVVITDEDSPLCHWAKLKEIYCICIAKNVGGRFSVLSSVGILPLMILGYDVQSLLDGAKIFVMNFLHRKEDHLLRKAIFLAKSRERYQNNVLFSYSSSFKDFNSWYVQLWAESLGKIDAYGKKVGLTPIALIGSIDQHSFLQLIVQGSLDKTVTFLNINRKNYTEPKIPDLRMEFLENTDYVNGASFAKLISKQQIATKETLQAEGIPTDEIVIDFLCEKSVGQLIVYFELLTSCVGKIMDINTYDQPGVEFGKIRLKEMFDVKT